MLSYCRYCPPFLSVLAKRVERCYRSLDKNKHTQLTRFTSWQPLNIIIKQKLDELKLGSVLFAILYTRCL